MRRPLAAILIAASIGLATMLFLTRPEPLPPGAAADRIVIEKAARKLTLYSSGRPLKTYRIALGRNPVGPKTREGDKKTPEGRYAIDSRNPGSGYHRALHISYPNPDDRDRARQMSVSPGGDIMIHGIKNGLGWIGPLHRFVDWTQGCIAVTNAEIEEIWQAAGDGTAVEIRP